MLPVEAWCPSPGPSPPRPSSPRGRGGRRTKKENASIALAFSVSLLSLGERRAGVVRGPAAPPRPCRPPPWQLLVRIPTVAFEIDSPVGIELDPFLFQQMPLVAFLHAETRSMADRA